MGLAASNEGFDPEDINFRPLNHQSKQRAAEYRRKIDPNGRLLGRPLSKYTPEELQQLIHDISLRLETSVVLRTMNDEAALIRHQLLRRRDLAVNRLWHIRNEAREKSFRAAVNKVSEPEAREQLEQELEKLQEASTALAAENQVGLAQRDRDYMLLRQELMERKWEVWGRILARDSVATMIGSILLVGLAVTLVVAMFKHFQVSDIVSNSFLIILGYFFGQSGERRNEKRDMSQK